ncbi:hypothetical protein AAHC03_024506 [Spirometra sp. Aus1]
MFPLANSFVHVIMYTYYGLAAMGAYRFLWWKKYLTVLQMVQFVIFLLHQSQVFTYNRDCDYPKVFPAAICFYAAVFLVLFGNFYVKAYWKRERLSKADWDAAAKKTSAATANGHTSNGVSKHHQNGVVKSAAASSPSTQKDSKRLCSRSVNRLSVSWILPVPMLVCLLFLTNFSSLKREACTRPKIGDSAARCFRCLHVFSLHPPYPPSPSLVLGKKGDAGPSHQQRPFVAQTIVACYTRPVCHELLCANVRLSPPPLPPPTVDPV